MRNAYEAATKRAEIIRALDTDLPLKAFCELYMEYVLTACGGNKVHAARILKIDRRTIQRKAKSRQPTDSG